MTKLSRTWLVAAAAALAPLAAASAAQLERVGLAEKAGGWPRELSGGQAQRVSIATSEGAALWW